ncbi:hypothetical protein [Paenibacillus periandrae]|nr:hypothetical protein [Paenibacillus periandrae]
MTRNESYGDCSTQQDMGQISGRERLVCRLPDPAQYSGLGILTGQGLAM